VDGDVYAQVLYLPSVNIPSKGTHAVIYVATEHNSVYAFDAAAPAEPLWHVDLSAVTEGAGPVPTSDVQVSLHSARSRHHVHPSHRHRDGYDLRARENEGAWAVRAAPACARCGDRRAAARSRADPRVSTGYRTATTAGSGRGTRASQPTARVVSTQSRGMAPSRPVPASTSITATPSYSSRSARTGSS